MLVSRFTTVRSGMLTVAGGVLSVLLLSFGTGCETQSYFDPTEMGRFGKTPIVVPILKNLDTGIEETDERFVNATEVRDSDLIVNKDDYTIGANDLIQVSITDLVAPGVETLKQMRVTQSGVISLPLIEQVKAAGLTESQLEQAISQAYRDKNLIQNAQVSVVTIEARNRIFTISGAVNQMSQYALIDPNTRLLDALVLARDVTSPLGIEYVYVIRQKSQDTVEGAAPIAVPAANPATQPAPDILAPRSDISPATGSPKLMTQEQPAAQTSQPASGAEGRIIIVDDKPMQIQSGQPMAGSAPTAVAPAPVAPVTETASNFAFNEPQEPSDVRIIRIPLEPLTKRGQLKYNIVIRPQDFIIVPQPVIGEYYIGGHTSRPGVYSLTARDITLRESIIAAGGLDQLAIPQRTEIVRKIGRFKTVYSRVDLAKVFAGEEPDILLKPDDQVMVGTNALAPFLQNFRNGFRLTYGFGFIYDRNYAGRSGGLDF
ncbi:MAG TPA: polysaccharide biosynthesis/export family protein [Tepidisphaeraceae bacterium]|nr:polysaccharide biosynthesis/export family protein [Tepidisphaeraceae bacterium]